MPWGGTPSTSESDAVRAMVGDTNTQSPLLSDDTYTLILATESRLNARASMACSALAAKYAVEMNRRVGDLWREAKVLFDHYRELAQWYRLEAARRGKPIPWAGGTSLSEIDATNDDTDRPDPAFDLGMQDSAYLPAFNRKDEDE